MNNNEEYLYFYYSASQHEMRDNMEAKLNKKFIPGEVLVMGEWKQFMIMTTSPYTNNTIISDLVLVAKGPKNKMRYKSWYSTWRV